MPVSKMCALGTGERARWRVQVWGLVRLKKVACVESRMDGTSASVLRIRTCKKEEGTFLV